MNLALVDVVLVRPRNPANVAAACRALKNMGLRSLVLVAVFGAASYLAMIAWLGEQQLRVLARELLSR